MWLSSHARAIMDRSNCTAQDGSAYVQQDVGLLSSAWWFLSARFFCVVHAGGLWCGLGVILWLPRGSFGTEAFEQESGELDSIQFWLLTRVQPVWMIQRTGYNCDHAVYILSRVLPSMTQGNAAGRGPLQGPRHACTCDLFCRCFHQTVCHRMYTLTWPACMCCYVRMQGRVDDNIETIKKRFRVFVEQSMPVIQTYEAVGKVRHATVSCFKFQPTRKTLAVHAYNTYGAVVRYERA